MKVFRGNFIDAPSVCAVFEEAAGGGDPRYIWSPCNAPARDPINHLAAVTWHVDWFQYEIAASLTVVAGHTSLAGRTRYYSVTGAGGLINGSSSPSGRSIAVQGQVRETTVPLFYHGLGYVPLFMIAFNGRTMPAGMIVQRVGKRGRTVSAYATTTTIELREVAWSSVDTLPAINLAYDIMCFRNPAKVPGEAMMRLNGAGLILGGGKVDTSKKYLRRTRVGESAFAIDRGPTTDWENGGVRVVTGGAVIDDDLYNGTFAGPAYIPVGV